MKDFKSIMKRNFFFIIIFYLYLLIENFACSPGLFEGPKAPVITGFEVSAYEVNPGDTVNLAVSVQDQGNGALHYEWSAEGGQFLPPFDRAQIKWKAPAVGGSFHITVKVSNDKKFTSHTEEIVVRSYLKPYVEILSPSEAEYFVQYSSLIIHVVAQHSNGINHLNLYVRDILRSTKSGHSSKEYEFSYKFSDSAGLTEIKVEAIANTTGTIGRDSVNIVIEGIVPGK